MKLIGLVLLGLLKCLGWLLVSLILLLLLVILALLFSPLRYRLEGYHEENADHASKAGSYAISFKVTWILHAVSVLADYDASGLTYKIRILGVDPLGVQAFLEKRKEARVARRKERAFKRASKKEAAERTQEAPAEEQGENEMEQSLAAMELDVHEKPATEPTEESVVEPKPTEESVVEPELSEENSVEPKPGTAKKDKAETGRKRKKRISLRQRLASVRTNVDRSIRRVKDATANARKKLGYFYQEFNDTSNRRAVSALWKELVRIFGHYKPRRLEAELSYSMGDPALTGEVLGAVSLVPLVYQYPFTIQPDFESEKLYVYGKGRIRGRIRLCHVLTAAIRLYCNSDIKKLYRKVREK